MEQELSHLAHSVNTRLDSNTAMSPADKIAAAVYSARKQSLVPGVAVMPALIGCLFLSSGMGLFVSSSTSPRDTAIESVRPDSAETIWQKEVTPHRGATFHLTLDLRDNLKATDARTGRLIWTERLPKIASSSAPLVFTERDKVFVSVANAEGAVYLIDGLRGGVLWMQNVSDRVDVSPLQIKNTVLAVACTDGKIYGLSIADGHIDYMIQTDSQITALEPVADGSGEHIYAIADKKRVLALNAMTGDLHWRGEVFGTATDSPILAANRIIAPTVDGANSKLWAFDNKGKLSWMNTFDRYSSLASADGYIAMAQGSIVTLIKAETGEPVHYWQLGRAPSELAIVKANGSLAVLTDQGNLSF